MDRPVEHPTCVKKDTLHGDRYRHPAYGVIHASRVTGHTELFGSSLNHNGFVRIEIHEAERTDHGAYESISQVGKVIAQVDMSEAQWVSFVSRMNCGSTPCTLNYKPTGMQAAPELPPQPMPAEKLAERIRAMGTHRTEYIEEHANALRAACESLPAKKRDAILKELGLLTQHLLANHTYNMGSLVKVKETLVVEATQEIDATVKGILTQLGVDKLQDLLALQAPAARQVIEALPSLPEGETEADKNKKRRS